MQYGDKTASVEMYSCTITASLLQLTLYNLDHSSSKLVNNECRDIHIHEHKHHSNELNIVRQYQRGGGGGGGKKRKK